MILRKINGAVLANFLYEMDFQVCSYKRWTLRGAVYTVCVISFNHRLSAAPLWLTFGHTLAPIVVKLDLDKDHIFSKLA